MDCSGNADAAWRANFLQSDRNDDAVTVEVSSVSDDIVSYSHHYSFPDGAKARSDSSLRFWSEPRLRQSVVGAGFVLERVEGGWRGEPVGAGDGELIELPKQSGSQLNRGGVQR